MRYGGSDLIVTFRTDMCRFIFLIKYVSSKKGISEKCLRIVSRGTECGPCNTGQLAQRFAMEVELNQVSALGPSLFNVVNDVRVIDADLVMDVIFEEANGRPPWNKCRRHRLCKTTEDYTENKFEKWIYR